jgi:hypothetical protein
MDNTNRTRYFLVRAFYTVRRKLDQLHMHESDFQRLIAVRMFDQNGSEIESRVSGSNKPTRLFGYSHWFIRKRPNGMISRRRELYHLLYNLFP